MLNSRWKYQCELTIVFQMSSLFLFTGWPGTNNFKEHASNQVLDFYVLFTTQGTKTLWENG